MATGVLRDGAGQWRHPGADGLAEIPRTRRARARAIAQASSSAATPASRAAEEHAQEGGSLRGAAGEQRRLPHDAERRQPLAARHEVAVAVERARNRRRGTRARRDADRSYGNGPVARRGVRCSDERGGEPRGRRAPRDRRQRSRRGAVAHQPAASPLRSCDGRACVRTPCQRAVERLDERRPCRRSKLSSRAGRARAAARHHRAQSGCRARAPSRSMSGNAAGTESARHRPPRCRRPPRRRGSPRPPRRSAGARTPRPSPPRRWAVRAQRLEQHAHLAATASASRRRSDGGDSGTRHSRPRRTTNRRCASGRASTSSDSRPSSPTERQRLGRAIEKRVRAALDDEAVLATVCTWPPAVPASSTVSSSGVPPRALPRRRV